MSAPRLLATASLLVLAASTVAPAAAAPAKSTDATAVRAAQLVSRMTPAEKQQLLHGVFPLLAKPAVPPAQWHAGHVRGLARLGIPDLEESDASLGVANAGRGPADDATALPSGLALAASFDPQLAYAGGAMIGKEARQKGFNVLLAGGVNLVREPRNGRNFEYLGEDPLLAGVMAGAAIRGVQSNHIVSTVKHFALNAQESGRHVLDAEIDPAALRESDLLAFQFAIEQGRPGSVMCAYNRVGGAYACENRDLFSILKDDWGWKGWVMSDWGAVHSAAAAAAGLDQESGQELDRQVFFDAPLKAAVVSGEIPAARIDDMVRRIVYGLAANGLLDAQPAIEPLDTAADAVVAQRAAEAGIVLLKNSKGVLPLTEQARRIAVIGGRADQGVWSGGGSSQVIPVGSIRLPAPHGVAPGWSSGIVLHPLAPLAAIKARAKGAQVVFRDGADVAAAVQAAREADVAIVFASQWTTEGADASLSLSTDQDELIAAVTAANPRTVVVLETGGPVLTPWIGQTAALVEAWYPGQRGADAITRVLFGDVDAAGRLPVSFPASAAQLPRPRLDGADRGPETLAPASEADRLTVRYTEGADVGYRWYQKTAARPSFPFGYGLSYTQFRYGDLQIKGGRRLTARFTVTNVGLRAGVDTPQVYAAGAGQQLRLVGWGRLALRPGETRALAISADPRLLAAFDAKARRWRLRGGDYRVVLAKSAGDVQQSRTTSLQPMTLKP